MTDLVAFLTARLGDEQKAAELARRANEWATGLLLVYSPIQVLADIDAKRRIIDDCEHATDVDEHAWRLADKVLCLLALPYADHPDYDESWRP